MSLRGRMVTFSALYTGLSAACDNLVTFGASIFAYHDPCEDEHIIVLLDCGSRKWRLIMFGLRRVSRGTGFVALIAMLGTLHGVAGVGNACSPPQQAPSQSAAPPEVLRCGPTKVNQQGELGTLAQRALGEDAQDRAAATQQLRQRGQAAINYLMHQTELRQSPRWSDVLDAVAQQRHAQFSGLYWHTSLEQALQVAQREKKPVLSLRLLGNLTDELSCANSRFFRTTLYPHTEVRELLANHFVLHWQSVRAVPIITIDFGDGRKIKRTITGNSLHLVMDSQGRGVDILPGLYSAASFVKSLQTSGPAAVELALADDVTFRAQRAAFHHLRLNEMHLHWADDCLKAKLPAVALGNPLDEEGWTKVATLYATEARPTAEVQKAMTIQGPPQAEVVMRLAITKSITETPMMRQVRNLTRTISEDTVKNEYQSHFLIHHCFTNREFAIGSESLVTYVYDQIFLSPLNDPWYGLAKPDVYSAIKSNGRIDAVTQNTSR